VIVRGAREAVVREHHAVADEDLVLDVHALADERVRGHLAACADEGVLLDLHERADARLVADRAAVEIHEIGVKDPDVLPEANAVCNGHAVIPQFVVVYRATGWMAPQASG